MSLQACKTFAVETARHAGALLKDRLDMAHIVEFKGEIDIVTESDQMAEAMILERIRTTYPDHGAMTEESAGLPAASEFRWIIDPLDGTTNYAHGYPTFCVSLALEIAGGVQIGVVFNPMLDEMFWAVRGQGAFLNDRKLHVSETTMLSRCLLATGFPYDIRESRENNLGNFVAMARKVQAIRRGGSAALDLAYVAAGRFDGFWELKLKPWDMAAGVLLVEEAGGRVTDLQGGKHRLDSPHILASNGQVHSDLQDVLARAVPIA